jgi:hypothetical protein
MRRRNNLTRYGGKDNGQMDSNEQNNQSTANRQRDERKTKTKLKKPLTWNAEKKNRRIERSNGVGGNRMQAKGDSAGEWKVRQVKVQTQVLYVL